MSHTPFAVAATYPQADDIGGGGGGGGRRLHARVRRRRRHLGLRPARQQARQLRALQVSEVEAAAA